MTKSGDQWTGTHATMELLFCLGAAAGYVICFPREQWASLPGGVPYPVVRAERGEPGAIA